MKTITFPLGPLFDDYGAVAPNAILVGYEPETDNLKQWFYDADLQTPAPNPIQAASDGRIPQLFLGEGKYRIRQYVPASEQAVIPDDMTDFPVGDDWTFVAQWFCEGETIVAENVHSVKLEYISDLSDIGGDDADWALVMNYISDGDCYPRWFRYVAVPLPADSGSIVQASDGGSWLLVASKAEPCDARIFGLSTSATDNTAAITHAEAYCYNNGGLELYIPNGTYAFTTSATIPIRVPLRFGSNVHFRVEAGKSVVWEIKNKYVIPQTTSVNADGTSDFSFDFSACSYVGTAYTIWGASTDLALFSGQDVHLHNTGFTSNDFALKKVYVDGNCQINVSSANNSIEEIVGNGGKVGCLTNSISVGKVGTSALSATISGFVIDELHADEDADFGAEYTFGTIVADGGVLTAPSHVIRVGNVRGDKMPCFGDTLVICSTAGLNFDAFSVLGNNAMASVAASNNGIVDLMGKELVLDTPSGSLVFNGTLTHDSDSANNILVSDAVFEHVVFKGAYVEVVSGSVGFNECVLDGGLKISVNRTASVGISAKGTTFNNFLEDDGSFTDNISFDSCSVHFPFSASSESRRRFINDNLSFNKCVFTNRIVGEDLASVWAEQNEVLEENAGVAFVQTEFNGSVATLKAHIKGNIPAPPYDYDGNGTLTHWAQTEGDMTIIGNTDGNTFQDYEHNRNRTMNCMVWSNWGLYGEGQSVRVGDKWKTAVEVSAATFSTCAPAEVFGLIASDSADGPYYPNKLFVIFNQGFGTGTKVQASAHFKMTDAEDL